MKRELLKILCEELNIEYKWYRSKKYYLKKINYAFINKLCGIPYEN